MKKSNVMLISFSHSATIVFVFLFLIIYFIEIFNHPDYYINNSILIVGFLWIIFCIPFVIISNLYLYKINIGKALFWGITGLIMYAAFIILTFQIGIMVASKFPFSIIVGILGLLSLILLIGINLLIYYIMRSSTPQEILGIKKSILNLGSQYTRLKVAEISEKCEADRYTITKVIRDMISKKEIYAEYFESSQSVSFNQQAINKDIDHLMAIYTEWEEKLSGKKI